MAPTTAGSSMPSIPTLTRASAFGVVIPDSGHSKHARCRNKDLDATWRGAALLHRGSTRRLNDATRRLLIRITPTLLLHAGVLEGLEAAKIEPADRALQLGERHTGAVRRDDEAIAEHDRELVRPAAARYLLVHQAAIHFVRAFRPVVAL